MRFTELEDRDPEVCSIIRDEEHRQKNSIELIASENFTSRAVMEAMGTVLTNKYAEGFPGKRYYGGCEQVDRLEQLAIDRVKYLFGAEHANVQPHSGSQANAAVYLATMKPGDRMLAMSLAHGGHLTHGSKVNFSGKTYNIIPYSLNDETGKLDYDSIEATACDCQPKVIVAGASAYSRFIDFERFRKIADKCGAVLIVDMAHIAGLVAAGVHPSPVPFADIVTSTTHKTLRGPRGGLILCKNEWARKIDSAVFPGTQGGPLLHVIAGKAVCFQEASTKAFRKYAERVVANAQIMANTLSKGGLRIVSGGTDNHLMLVDLTDVGISGKEAENRLAYYDIVVNMNMIPGDKRTARETSGIRIGTAAMTTLGMSQSGADFLANCIVSILKGDVKPQDERQMAMNLYAFRKSLDALP